MKNRPMNTVLLDGIKLCESIPNEVRDHVGMISLQERQLLYTLARDYYKDKGAIIDAGTFLGASTSALAYGLRDNKRIKDKNKIHKIHSFERAIVADNFSRHAQKLNIEIPKIGSSYKDILETLLSPFSEYVNLHIGDIQEYKGEDIDKIAICFLDILKAPVMSAQCMNLFLPKLNKGAYLIQQDYFFDDLPWIKVMTESLAGTYLKYKGEVRSSALYFVAKQIKPSNIIDTFKLDYKTQAILHEQAEQRTDDPCRKYLMQLSRARLFASFRMFNESKKIWNQADKEYSQYIYDDNGQYKSNIVWRTDRLKNYIERLVNSDNAKA